MKKVHLLFLFFVLAAEISAQKISFTGYGAAGFRYINRIRIIEINQETYFEGKFQTDISINKNIDAQLDFRGNSQNQQVEFREYSAVFKYIDKLKFKVGNIKKPFSSEYLENRENLLTVERSLLTEAAGRIGYTGRSVGIMAYYKFSKKREDYPHSYFFYAFKNNNLQTGLVGRYIHHFDDVELGGNYFLLNTGGDYPIVTNGFASNILYKKKKFLVEAELMLLQDPVEGIRRQLQKNDDKVYGFGGRISSAVEFDTGGKVIEEIEPLFLFSYYQPDIDLSDQHTIQILAGVNFYFDKDVRLRFNADAHFTKNEFSKKYSSYDSRIVLEIQVRY